MALSAGALALSCPTYAFASQGGGIEAILPEMSEFIPYARRLHYSVDRPGQVWLARLRQDA